MGSRGFGFGRAGLCLLGLAWAATAQAQALSPEVSRGLAWLQGQVQADGTLAGEASSVATALQNRSEAGQALAALASLPSNLADAIAADTDGNTEYLARQAIALVAAGRDASPQIGQILLRRNADRGIGGGPGFESNPLDSAWTVMALARAGQGASSAAADARAYLMTTLQSDGGVSAPNDAARIEYSAATLIALQTVADGSTATTVRALTSWLLLRQGPDGSWQGDVYLTALSAIALSPVVSDPAVRAAAGSFLRAGQSAAGSWQDDAFLTAIALRALSAGSASPAAAALAGKVIDQRTSQPLAGVSVAVSGAGSANALTDSDGRFSVGGLAAGTYSAQLARAGYTGASVSYTVFAGQTLDAGTIALSQVQTTAIVRGRVSAATGGAALPGVAVAITGAASLSALTDAFGSFEFSAVPPGAITITASLAGYQGATGSAALAGGQTVVFSPSLYTVAETAPSTGRFIGRTVVAGTNAPLAGVSVVLNGAVAGTSAGDGRFDLTLNPASYTALYTLAGYDNVTQGFLLAAGATVDAGAVALPAQRTTTKLSGLVTDSGGAPLAGATVQVLNGPSAATGADGAYAFASLAGSNFDLRASATGYASQLISLQVPRPADVVQNFALLGGSTTFSIGDPAVSPPSAGANTDVSVSASVSNIGSAGASAVLVLQAIDLDGANGAAGAVIGTAPAFDTNGAPIALLQLDPGQSKAVRFVWNSGRFAAGRYQLLIRLVAPSSITAATPQGAVLLERPAQVAVFAQTHFAGSVTANPPVLRAGTNTAVKLSATIQNDGNAQLPAQSYTLNVVNTQTNAVANTQTAAGKTLAVAELDQLVFADWTPPAGGNFRVELTSSSAGEGKITTSLYVGDSGSATYTTNKLVVPAGTQTVRASVKVTGQDVANGTISDPLAPLVRAAVQKAVSFNDSAARTWTLTNRCMGCHVQSQALIGGELNRKFTTFDQRARATIFNAITDELRTNGSLSDTQGGSFPRSMTTLGLWGLVAYHDLPSIASTLKKNGDFLVTQQDTAGRWFADHVSGWWQSEVTNTSLNLRNLVDVSAALSAVDPQTVRNWATRAFTPILGMTSRGSLSVDGAGNLYFSAGSLGRVVQIKPDGTFGTTWTGLNDPRGTLDFGGQILVATGLGVFRLNPDGTSTLLNNVTTLDNLALGPDGKIYSDDFPNHRIYQIDPSAGFAASIWFQNTAANGSPLLNPARLSFSQSGDLLVPNFGRQNVLRIRPDKSFDVVVEMTRGGPLHVMQQGGRFLLSTDQGVFSYNADWEGERLLNERVDMIAALPDGRLVSVVNGVLNIKEIFFTVPSVAASLSSYAAAIDKATTFLTNLNSLGNTDNIVLAHHLLGLAGAAKFYKDSNPARAASLTAKMQQIAATLQARVRTDGGWGWFTSSGSDSMVTAQVGVALDTLNPSPDDPIVRKAVQLLLARQQADGSWISENGVLTTKQAATSWVAIWLPIILDRLGGIDTDLSVTFPANVAMSNPDKAPTSSTVNPDGTTTKLWKLIGVTADGQTINYDLTLADLAVNEARAVSTEAHLAFENSFTGGTVNAPIGIPRVTASAFLDLGVTTDRASYGPNASVNITGQVTNTDGGLAGGSVKFDIVAPDDALVTSVGTLAFSSLAAGASTSLAPAWNTGATLAGAGYHVVASLYDALGRFVGTARSDFNLVSDTNALVSGGITADKLAYLPAETVRITSRVRNVTQNQPLDGLTAVTTITNPDGTVRFVQSEPIVQLGQGALRDFNYAVPLAYAAAGSYAAALSVRDSMGLEVASSGTSFTVGSSAVSGSGLTGALSAAPKPVPFGDPIALTAAVNNLGNADLPALQAKIAVIDPAAQAVLAEFPATLALPQGQTAPLSFAWTANATVGQTYVAVLSATTGAATLTLAQVAFTIAPPVTRVTGSLIAAPKQVPQGVAVSLSAGVSNTGFGAITGLPVSVTVVNSATQQLVAQFTDSLSIGLQQTVQRAYSWPATGAVGTSYTAALTATVGGVARTLAQDTFSIIAPPVQLDVTLAGAKQARVLVLLSCKLGEDDGRSDHDHDMDHDHDDHDWDHGDAAKQSCLAQRSAALASLLSGLGVNYRITTSEYDFRRAFRSGQYNTYWITGGSLKLDNDFDDEVREAVFRGDALILDAVHDERNHELDAVAGTDVHGKLSVPNPAINVSGSIFASGTLPSSGRPLKLDLTTGSAQAVFAAAPSRPAIVTNQYGLGRSVLFAYDLVGTLMAQPSSALNDLVAAALGWVAPAPAATLEARTYTVLRAKVTNVGVGADLRATFTPPAGATVVGTAPAATPDASGRPVWTFTLDSGATKNLDIALRLPSSGGSFTASISIDSARGDLATPFSTSATLTVEAADTVAPRVAGELAALAVASNDKSDRDHAVSSIQAAQASLAAGAYDQAIALLAEAAERLMKIGSVDVTPYRVEVDRLLQEAEARWFLVQP